MTAPSLPPATDALVRPALHLAFAVARAGVAADPPVDPPRVLRPFLRFVRLPDSALAAVRRALDEDADFRSRVMDVAGEDDVGRAAWLFLNRPTGWDDELAELAGAEEAVAEAAREAKEERTAVRRLAQAEQAVERAEKLASRARAEATAAAAELAEERRSRRAAEERADVLSQRVVALEQEAAAGRKRAAEAKLELSRWRARVAELQAELERVTARPSFDPTAVHATLADAEEALRAVRRAVDEEQAKVEAGAAPASGEDQPAAAVEPQPSLALLPPGAEWSLSPPTGGRQPPTGGRQPPTGSGASRRRPSPLPPAVFEDSPEAAAHLVRLPDVLVLVDGYNSAMAIWPGVVPAELRQRLVDALAELSARSGAEVRVVFDGAELGGSVARPGGRLAVRVTFSPPDVEADDVILAMVDDVPVDRPVVVASSDRRVQDGARSRGANVVSSAQLAQLVGR